MIIKKRFLTCCVALLMIAAPAVTIAQNHPAGGSKERDLIAILQSDAAKGEKFPEKMESSSGLPIGRLRFACCRRILHVFPPPALPAGTAPPNGPVPTAQRCPPARHEGGAQCGHFPHTMAWGPARNTPQSTRAGPSRAPLALPPEDQGNLSRCCASKVWGVCVA